MSLNQIPVSPKHSAPTIVLTGGGSGGHLTPLLSLAHALKKADLKAKLVFIAWKGDKLDALGSRIEEFDRVCFIPAGKFRRYHGESLLAHLLDIKSLALNVRDFFRVLAGVITARRLLKKIKPSVVFVKGGFVGVPVAMAARTLKIPIVTHDSDAIGGLANKVAGRWALVHTTGLSPKYYDYPLESVRQVGIPIDERIKPVTEQLQAEYKEAAGVAKDSLVLLIAGGGLGSQRLNALIIAIAADLLTQHPNLSIIHFCGLKNLEQVNRSYASFSESQLNRIMVIGFSDEFYRYSAAADLIISRAGATTLAEFASQGKACIVIPSPFLAAGHQLKNAEELRRAGAAEVTPENIKPQELERSINDLLKDSSKRHRLAKNLSKTFKPGAADELAKILLETAKKS